MKIQIDNEVRDATAEEIAMIQTAQNEHFARLAALETAAAAKISARAKLKALGLTDDEIVALVG